MDGSALRDYATEAIRYWEPRRLFYNLLLVVVVVITFWVELPSSRAVITSIPFSGCFCSPLSLTSLIAPPTLSTYSCRRQPFAHIGSSSGGSCLRWEARLLPS